MPLPDERPLVVLPPLTPLQQGLPLGGLTILVVEDSRFAADALRLMCQHSGARLRRAESLEAARSHLALYTPDVVIVDIGLPDGSGLDLIADLTAGGRAGAMGAASEPSAAQTAASVRRLAQDLSAVDDDDRRAQIFQAVHVLRAAMGSVEAQTPRVFAMSAEPAWREQVLAAGAVGFFEKPLPDLAAFQAALLDGLGDRHLRPPAFNAHINPDPMALIDDLRLARAALDAESARPVEGWLLGFLAGVAHLSQDADLTAALKRGARDALRHILSARIDAAEAFAPSARGGAISAELGPSSEDL